jgi:hypothetical protein
MLSIINKLLFIAIMVAGSVFAVNYIEAPSPTTNAITRGFTTSFSAPTTSQTNPSTPTQNTTVNWSGYDASNGTYSGISGSWTIPSVSGSDPSSADATWIGLGGVNSTDLIQTGTQNEVNQDGSVQTTAFYELLPDNETPIQAISVNPGDKISASINLISSGFWQISLLDQTNGQRYTTEVQYDSSESSAEWVEEDPSDVTGQQVPLDNFGTVNITGASATLNGQSEDLNSLGAQVLTMVNDADQPLATVSGLSSQGSDFSVTRTSASVDAGEFTGGNGWIRQGHGMSSFGQYGYHSGYSSGGRWRHRTTVW